MRGREKFEKYHYIISLIILFWRIFPKGFRVKLFAHYRNRNGNIGLVLRYTLLKTLAKHLGDNVAIFPGTFILEPANLSIGNNVSIQPMCYIDATGGVDIFDSVSIAHGSTIMSTDHGIQIDTKDMKDQPLKEGKVIIEENTWIAAHCCILQGVKIPSGSVIAAGAIVNKKLQMAPDCVWGGVPAKLIKHR